MGLILDFPGIIIYLFSFLPAPVANMIRGVIALCAVVLVMRFVSLVKSMIPFL